MSIDAMRSYILNRYPGWNKIYVMPPDQVIAIYHSMVERESKKQEVKKARRIPKETPGYQFTIFDLMKED